MTSVLPVPMVPRFSTSTGGHRGTGSARNGGKLFFVNRATGEVQEEAPGEGSPFVSASSLSAMEINLLCEALEKKGQNKTARRLRFYWAGGA